MGFDLSRWIDPGRVTAIRDSPRLNNLWGGALYPVASSLSLIAETGGRRQLKVNCADAAHNLGFA